MQHPKVGAKELATETRSVLEQFLSEESPERKTAIATLRQGDVESAITRLTRLADSKVAVLQQTRKSAAADLYLAGLLAGRLNYARGIELLQRAVALDPSGVAANNMLAVFHLNRNENAAAEAILLPLRGRDLSDADFALIENTPGRRSMNTDLTLPNGDSGTSSRRAGEARIIRASLPRSETSDWYIPSGTSWKRRGRTFELSLSVNNGSDSTLTANQYCNLRRTYLERQDYRRARENYNLALDIFSHSLSTSFHTRIK
ncbi:MAG: hypothetical protein M3M96_09605 [Candidatus Eremiobacteraeota bacterium]|nr:hypothetical protein [Candidatus Eremiobacteraeota bacterium]